MKTGSLQTPEDYKERENVPLTVVSSTTNEGSRTQNLKTGEEEEKEEEKEELMLFVLRRRLNDTYMLYLLFMANYKIR